MYFRKYFHERSIQAQVLYLAMNTYNSENYSPQSLKEVCSN